MSEHFHKLLKFTEKNARHLRILPYAFLSAAMALIGGKSINDNSDGDIVDHSQSDPSKYGSHIIPYALADSPHSSDSSSDGDADSGGDSGGGGSDSDGGCCFPGDVDVLTPGGRVPIAKLGEGDSVVSFDAESGTFATSTIEKTLRHGEADESGHDFAKHPLLRITFEVMGEATELMVTSNHPLYDPASEKYREAGEFGVGDTLKTQEGSVWIVGIEQTDPDTYFENVATPVVYNLTLSDGPHSYIAGGVVVHNKDSDGSDCCVPATARIQTTSGPVPIADIAIGTEVLSYDEGSDEWSTSIVGEVIVHDGEKHSRHDFEKHALYEVVHEDGVGEKGILVITGNHRVFDPKRREYRPIEEFQKGEKFFSKKGPLSIVAKETLKADDYFKSTDAVVFNLHMKSGSPNYIADGVLVHNTK